MLAVPWLSRGVPWPCPVVSRGLSRGPVLAVPWCPVVLQETRRQGDGKDCRAGPWRTGLAVGVVWGPRWSFWRVFTKKMLSRGVPWLSRGCPVHGVWSRGPVVPWSTGEMSSGRSKNAFVFDFLFAFGRLVGDIGWFSV